MAPDIVVKWGLSNFLSLLKRGKEQQKMNSNRLVNWLKSASMRYLIKQNFYQFALGGADVVLGIQWLATLNTVQANWKEMFMKFTIDGKEYKLHGLPLNLQLSTTFSHLTSEIVELDTLDQQLSFL
ncbi:retrotransposon gag domain, Retroviral aspartyl protease [Artemisia annua]|uniref:Retrotransposon gag domain, Retroviral aspartyl protease n=1 Tax=Artemisia annua TaxID=35608 RepID=A0A2U1LNQ8_ARTAN|nr:retrotransposon gag domain, Retroviral aspartyl protease [Artemisia annua]